MRCDVCQKVFKPGDEKVQDRVTVSIRCGANPGRTYRTVWRHEECKRE